MSNKVSQEFGELAKTIEEKVTCFLSVDKYSNSSSYIGVCAVNLLLRELKLHSFWKMVFLT